MIAQSTSGAREIKIPYIFTRHKASEETFFSKRVINICNGDVADFTPFSRFQSSV